MDSSGTDLWSPTSPASNDPTSISLFDFNTLNFPLPSELENNQDSPFMENFYR